MNILVLNCGSSSIKFALFQEEQKVVKGIIERIGGEDAIINYEIPSKDIKHKTVAAVLTHQEGIKILVEEILPQSGIEKIDAVGHRVVHGGEKYSSPVIIDADVKKDIEECIPMAPLHNPHHLAGIVAIENFLPKVPNVAVFDTAFFQTIPQEAAIYGLPYKYYEKYKIKKYGFHGTSHYYLMLRTAEILKTKIEKLKIITCHLGNGSSITAIKYGKSIDTSMGFTPAAGVLMGTRTGDIDPEIVSYIQTLEGLTPKDVSVIINKQSGLLGVSGISNDMRKIIDAMKENHRAQLAFKMFCYTVKKYISMYIGILNGVDAIVFSAGIGENSYLTRQEILKDMDNLGIVLDQKLNEKSVGIDAVISSKKSKVKILVIKTDEEVMIANFTKKLINS
jgi:acetate kinase